MAYFLCYPDRHRHQTGLKGNQVRSKNTVFKRLNQAFSVKFSTLGLPSGMVRRIDPKGTFYYSKDYRKFTSYKSAVEHNRSI